MYMCGAHRTLRLNLISGYLYHLWCASECFSSLATVEPLNKGHVDTSHFIHCRVILTQ